MLGSRPAVVDLSLLNAENELSLACRDDDMDTAVHGSRVEHEKAGRASEISGCILFSFCLHTWRERSWHSECSGHCHCHRYLHKPSIGLYSIRVGKIAVRRNVAAMLGNNFLEPSHAL